jgi:hypothetical protein
MMVKRQEITTNRLLKVMKIARLPTLSINSPRKGEQPAEMKKGKLYSSLAVIFGMLKSFISMLEVN